MKRSLISRLGVWASVYVANRVRVMKYCMHVHALSRVRLRSSVCMASFVCEFAMTCSFDKVI